MRNLFLFPLLLTYKITKYNAGKLILTFLTFLCFFCAEKYFYEDRTVYREIVHEFKRNGNYIYLYENISNSTVSYESIVSSKPITLKNHIYYYKESQGWYIGFYVIGVILSIITFVALLLSFTTSDDDITWDFKKCLMSTFSFFIICEIESNKFYYMIFGRLIIESDRQIKPYYTMAQELSIRNFTDIYNCPKFKTKRQNRSSVLSKLGIK